MEKLLFVAIACAISLCPGRLNAGDDGVAAPRREFRQSQVYPYVFEPVSYLLTGGPKAMRFLPPEFPCAHRDAPPLPAASPVPTHTLAPDTEVPEKEKNVAVATPPLDPQPTPIPPAFPPPVNAPSAGGPDLNQAPDEVMTYFKNPYNSGPRGPHLFDPIFEPGYHEGPQSKATFKVSDKP